MVKNPGDSTTRASVIFAAKRVQWDAMYVANSLIDIWPLLTDAQGFTFHS